jgi:pimeloyl-ACP methyl ester carboxylesterase
MYKTCKVLYLAYFFFLLSFTSAWSQTDTLIFINNTQVDIIFPDSSVLHRNILVLHGWNFSQDDICKKSDFCKKAKKLGFVLIMPAMQKSIYQSVNYPETRQDWKYYHTRYWITDTLIPFLQRHFSLLLPSQMNYLFGISTGARGVALIACYDTVHLFSAAAALSGDYDQTQMPDDNLIKGYYGQFDYFPDRWKGIDNPALNAWRINIPFFLAHGIEDSVVPYHQTEIFFHNFKPEIAKMSKIILIPSGKHNYLFWSGQYDSIFQFFIQISHRNHQ